MTTEIRDKLFTVIRSGMDLETHNITLSDAECQELLEIGMSQSVVPVLYRGMKRLAVPDERIGKFRQARFGDIGQTVRTSDALEKICAALEEAEIPYIPLKGAVLRNLYPESNMRTSFDIDLLVHEEDLDRAVEIVEEKTDFTKVKKRFHDISMVNKYVHLELHFSIMEIMENIDQLLERVWDYAVPSDHPFQYTLTPEFQLFHIIAHMSYHMVHGGLGIRSFLDLWLLLEKTQFDGQIVRSMCSDCGILTFYEKCCELADAWMREKPISHELTVFESYILAGGVFGKKENALAAGQRKHRGFRYAMHRLFMSRALLESEYPELKEKPYLMPLCQIRRWLRLLKPQKRKQIIMELNQTRQMDSEAIDSFDKLLTSLGL